MNLFDITGYKAIVTGGTRGLGYGMAEGLMEAGAHVVLFGSNEKVHQVASGFSARGFRCDGVEVDLGSADACEKGFREAVRLLAGLDVIVNAAGIQRRHQSPNFPLGDWQEILDVNLTAPFILCQLAAAEYLKKEKPYGKIINIASALSFFGGQTVPAYAASKGGIAQLTKALCNELAVHGINVNAIAPGYMDTEMNTALTDPQNPRYQVITDRIPAGRWGTGDDLKGMCVFLSSHASDYVNGAILPVDGGYLVK